MATLREIDRFARLMRERMAMLSTQRVLWWEVICVRSCDDTRCMQVRGQGYMYIREMKDVCHILVDVHLVICQMKHEAIIGFIGFICFVHHLVHRPIDDRPIDYRTVRWSITITPCAIRLRTMFGCSLSFDAGVVKPTLSTPSTALFTSNQSIAPL